MSDIYDETLDMEQLRNENEKLKAQLKYLNEENTIISSMNDMKKRYDELMQNTVSIDQFNYTTEQLEEHSKIIKSISMINDVNFENLDNLTDNLKRYINDRISKESREPTFQENRIQKRLDDLLNRLLLITEIVNKIDEHECDCHH